VSKVKKSRLLNINRADLLQRLESVQPGLSNTDILEQSSSFVFRKSKVVTFNGEIVCKAHSGLPLQVEGAVTAGQLLNLFRSLPEEIVQVRFTGKEMVILGKGRGAKVRMDAELSLPTKNVEWPKPGDWKELSPKFNEAITIVQECAGKDQSQFAMTCVHLTPKYVEACDNFQLTRYRVKTPLSKNILVRKDSIKHIPMLSMTEIAETYDWVHFRNPGGVQVGIKRFHEEEFPPMEHLLAARGKPMRLPKGLSGAAKMAKKFSEENKDDDAVLVEIRQGKIKVTGIGFSGRYWEFKNTKYRGDSLAFLIPPNLLDQITKRHNECQISNESLRVDGTRWVYVTSLGDPEEAEREREEAAAAAEDGGGDQGDEE
jgi:hypothetical protein